MQELIDFRETLPGVQVRDNNMTRKNDALNGNSVAERQRVSGISEHGIELRLEADQTRQELA